MQIKDFMDVEVDLHTSINVDVEANKYSSNLREQRKYITKYF